MTNLEALVALNMVGNIGSIRLKRLLDYFDKPEGIFKAPVDKLTGACGLSEDLANRMRLFKNEDLNREFKRASKLSLKILTLEDTGYPENLKNIPGAPLVLYVSGSLAPEDNLAIGIVGSRRASFYGLSNAEKFAFELALKGITIVSGMARGVDTYSHRGALKAGGRTLAVMGSGFNNIYPEENKKLADEISRSGAVISEFPIDEQPLRENFPRRNRVISGLSLGVLVAEAAKNSGALITADFALEQGREVFALPGRIDSASSYGANSLIQQGAKLVTNTDDILEEFNLAGASREKVCCPERQNLCGEEENKLYALINNQAISLDGLVEKTRMEIPRLAGILLNLEIKKLIRQLPGKQFVRSS